MFIPISAAVLILITAALLALPVATLLKQTYNNARNFMDFMIIGSYQTKLYVDPPLGTLKTDFLYHDLVKVIVTRSIVCQQK